MSHVEFDWQSPVHQHWLREWGRYNTVIRYDERGSGLSDWDVEDLSFESWVRDLEAVVEAAGVKRFPLFAMSQAGAVAVAYAARHPEKVSHLILYGAYLRGWLHRDLAPKEEEEERLMLELMRIGWERDNPAFRQFFAAQLMPGASKEQLDSLNELMRISAAPENAVKLEREMHRVDVRDLAPQVTVPALVAHTREDGAVPFEEGRLLAASLPNAEFVALDGRNHILLEGEPAFTQFWLAVRRFLDQPPPAGRAEQLPFPL
jgi:pimeloyl-ACP methyl ester carboxylesterase